MGILDVGKKKHIQIHITGRFKEVQRYESLQRRRKFFIFLDIIAIIFLLIGMFEIYLKKYITGALLILVTVIIIAYFILRKKQRRKFHKKKK